MFNPKGANKAFTIGDSSRRRYLYYLAREKIAGFYSKV